MSSENIIKGLEWSAVIGSVVGIVIYVCYKKPAFFQKMKSGFRSFRTCLSFAREHKGIWVFSVLQIILSGLILIAMTLLELYGKAYWSKSFWGSKTYFITAIAIVISIILFFFLHRFFSVCAAHYTLAILDSQKISWWQSLKRSSRNWWLILKLVILDSLIRMLTNRNKDKKESGIPFINSFLKALFGLAWSAAIYFINPVIASENSSLRASICRSAEVMKNNFGHLVGFQLGTGLLYLPFVMALIMAGTFFWLAHLAQHLFTVHKMLFVASLVTIVLAVVLFIVAFIIQGVVNSIFTAAAYNFTQGKPTGPFDAHFIQQAARVTEEKTKI